MKKIRRAGRPAHLIYRVVLTANLGLSHPKLRDLPGCLHNLMMVVMATVMMMMPMVVVMARNEVMMAMMVMMTAMMMVMAPMVMMLHLDQWILNGDRRGRKRSGLNGRDVESEREAGSEHSG